MRPLRPLLAEIPLLAGIAGGVWGLVRWGGAFGRPDCPLGNGWWDGFLAAAVLGSDLTVRPNPWRGALYPHLLARLGEGAGYLEAAVGIASVSMVLVVVAAGLTGRALAGPWAGGLAALSIGLVHDLAVSSRVTTFYPPLAAATGLALALGLACARWPRWSLALGAGLAQAAAWALDPRGALLLPVTGGLILVAALGAEGRAWRRALLPLLFVAALAPRWTVARMDPRFSGLPLGIAVFEQRAVALRWIRISGDPVLVGACEGEPDRAWPTPGTLSSPCARATLRFNLRERIPRGLPFPAALTLLAVPIACWPSRREPLPRRRAAFAALLGLGAPALLLLLQALWTPLPERYLLHLAAPLAAVVPVALTRLAGRSPGGIARWIGPGAAAAGAAWLLGADVARRDLPGPMEMDAIRRAECAALPEARDRLAPGDKLLECGSTRVALALLPSRWGSLEGAARGPDAAACAAWSAGPPVGSGRTWLATGSRDPPGPGWTREVLLGDPPVHWALWRWTGR